MSAAGRLTLYGAPGSGAVAVEAALTLLGQPYEVIEAVTWAEEAARERVAPRNAMRQVPTLIYPDGEVMTESAAILIDLADRHPAARLSPAPQSPLRRPFLRWMLFVSSAIYSLYWVKAEPARIGVPAAARELVVEGVHARISHCWAHMDKELVPGHWLLGGELTVLDLYVAVISRFGPWRERFYETAPRLAEVVRRVDAEPRLAALWQRCFPEDEGED